MEYREPSHPARAGRFSRRESVFLVTAAAVIAVAVWWLWDWQVYDDGAPEFVMPRYAQLIASVGAGAFGALILFGLFHMIHDVAKRIRRSAKKSN